MCPRRSENKRIGIIALKKFLKEKCGELYRKIVLEQASPEYIARGWAIGMFFGCLLPFGVQLLFSIPAAFILRGSKIGATVGTFITNHFTIFVIYPLQCYFGAFLIGKPLSYSAISEAMSGVIEKQNWDSLLALGWDIVIAFFVGGALIALFFTPITYFLIKSIVKKYRAKPPAQSDE